MKLEILFEHEIIITLIALSLLLVGAYICGKLMELIKAPKVVGEILGGMLFGGTFLYYVIPNIMTNIFQRYDGEGKVLNIFYQLGLIFLMLSSGFNTQIDIDKKNTKIIGFTFIGATIIPMVLALPFVNCFKDNFIGSSNANLSFILVFIIGIAITSIPVISKIFFDMGIMNTTFSNIVLTVSTIQDLCLWIMLNIATHIATTGEINLIKMFIIVIMTLGIFIIAKFISEHIHKNYLLKTKIIDFYTVSFVALLIVCAIFYQFGINIMYSAFLVGYIIRSLSQKDEETSKRMESIANFSFSFFIPIYFALVGIQLNLLNDFSLLRFILFFILAFSLEAIGTIIMLLFTNLKRISIINFAITMNARGGPGIVLATVAYSYNIINVEFFTVLILTTMLSSLIAGYWLRYQQKKDAQIFINLMK